MAALPWLPEARAAVMKVARAEEGQPNQDSGGTMNSPIDTEPFNYQATSKRNGDFLADYFRSAFDIDTSVFDDSKRTAERFSGFLKDAVAAMSEVKRLYTVLDGLKRRHMPMPGVPGAPVKCTSCSLHGAEVLWPCEPYKTADAALPEGWPF